MKRLSRWIPSWAFCMLVLTIGLSLIYLYPLLIPGGNALASHADASESLQITPSVSITADTTSTPEPDLEGRVGANAGLVCGAVALVIIIIAGLMRSTRWMPYRGGDEKHESE